MSYNILRKIQLLFNFPFWWIISKKKKYFNFVFPNLRFIRSKRFNYQHLPICNQKTLLTGKGEISIGKNCKFGYKPGGFHRGGSIELQARYKNAIINIGNNVATNNNIFICAANNIEIGSNTLIGQNVTIMDFEAHGILPHLRNKVGEIGNVILGENVWIGIMLQY
ncbi:hypothetical protein MKD41_08360 [Lutibacter sp. A64]|uniref:hypothetical protein n=1 Tax=Lutibacter sp. A64 TaxID=2918526 RepID=UPI001F065BB0|nr:hypothetical protein [Lutibacter sp. A64]UMB55473.1 hypothetical protein MKD41_08360 [Lutibacter sp. A64]